MEKKERTVMKNIFFTICTFLVVVAMIVGCAPQATATPAVAPTNAQPTVEQPTIEQPTIVPQSFDWKKYAGTEITLLLDEHPWTVGLRTVIDDFTKETGIKVNMQPFAEDLYFDKMELALRSDKPIADVYFEPMDSVGFDQFSANLIQPLTPFIKDPTMTNPDYDLADFPEGFRSTATFPPGDSNSQLYAIPITFETYILFYNKDLVNKYLNGKVPETFDELIAAADKITKEGKGEVYWAAMRGIRSDTIMDTLTGVVFDAWGSDSTPLPYNIWFDGDWKKGRFTEPRIVKGLSNYAAMMKAGPPNIQAMDWYEANQLFEQGKIAFYIDASLFGPGYEDPQQSQVAGKVGYAPLPKTDKGSMTGHWMWGLGIPANSQKKEAAWYFIQWATSKVIEPKIGTSTGGAARMSTWSNEIYTKALNPGYVEAVQTAMKTSRPTAVFSASWKEIGIMVVDAVQAMYGGTDPQKACEDLQKKAMEVTNK
jgi:multiple sugar transport system substrate-binding protein